MILNDFSFSDLSLKNLGIGGLGDEYQVTEENGYKVIKNKFGQIISKEPIEEEKTKENEEEKSYLKEPGKNDELVRTNAQKEQDKNTEIIQANSATDKIDKEYQDAVIELASLLQKGKNEEEDQILEEWAEAETTADKLTSVTADNTTVIEGVKEFISKLTSLADKTQDYNEKAKREEEQNETIKPIEDTESAADNPNVTEEDEESILNNNFFNSALETTETEEEIPDEETEESEV